MKFFSFFQKWYSKSVENYFHFCSFWEPHWSRFRLRIFFRATTCIIYVFRTSLWSHSFATKDARVSQDTPIICRTVWIKTLEFKNFRIHHHFWSLWSFKKKSFFWSHNKWIQIQIQSDLSFIWPCCGYVLGSIWSGLSIGSNQNILWHTNPFLLQENENFLILTKMILQVS